MWKRAQLQKMPQPKNLPAAVAEAKSDSAVALVKI